MIKAIREVLAYFTVNVQQKTIATESADSTGGLTLITKARIERNLGHPIHDIFNSYILPG